VGHSYTVTATKPSKIYYFKYTKNKPKRFSCNHYYVYPHFNLDGNREYDSDFVKLKLFKIEDIGDCHIPCEHAEYTNGIKILEEVDISNHIQYDEDGNVTYIKEYDDYDLQWYRFYFKYDNGKMIEANHQFMHNKKYYTEFHYRYIYDKRNNLIEIQEHNGKDFIMSEMGKYDEENRLIEYKNKNDFYFKKVFDLDGKLIYTLDGGVEIKRV
jgi:hypothetical protein